MVVSDFCEMPERVFGPASGSSDSSNENSSERIDLVVKTAIPGIGYKILVGGLLVRSTERIAVPLGESELMRSWKFV